ncbi:MAG: photosynthetic complex putative assembly protein PuhB [Pseudomonadota bacterium]
MSDDDFATEPVRGLPEAPPAGEQILWQGVPDWRRLAIEALALRWVGGYFAVLALWRGLAVGADAGLVHGILNAVPYLVLGLIVVGLLAGIAWLQARATVYTITNRRVAMRVGVALTVTLNLPYTHVAAADLDMRPGGTGTIALSLSENAKLSYLILWPHARPWAMRRPQPALRCVPDAERVAGILAEAARMRLNETAVSIAAIQVAAE